MPPESSPPDPTAVTSPATPWLFPPDPPSDDYLTAHDVLHPDDVTVADLPDNATPAEHALDRVALATTTFAGKWCLELPPEDVDAYWDTITDLTASTDIWQAKVSTAYGRDAGGYPHHLIAIYTPTYVDTDDVYRVHARLEDVFDAPLDIGYKPDIYTQHNIYPDTAAAYGLHTEYRYTA